MAPPAAPGARGGDVTADPLRALAGDARVRVRSPGPPDPDGTCVVYWMQRAQRGVDNAALDTAVHVANALAQPVVVFLAPVPFYPGGNARHYQFLFEGFADLPATLARRQIGLVYREHPGHRLVPFCREVGASLVIGDENPLREPERWRERVARDLHVPLWTVDADVVVPSGLLGKEQYAARTIRPRLRRLLPQYLKPAGNPRARVRWTRSRSVGAGRIPDGLPASFPVDRSVAPVSTLRGGMREGRRVLRRFLRHGLRGYADRRNAPGQEGTSRLSPYLHFGHLDPRAVALAVQEADAPRADRDAFLEQLIVRRELGVNFVRYNSRYDTLDGIEPWARATLDRHRGDRRSPVYNERRLEQAETHDQLWNAAQRQVVDSGWMHGYLRMYWAKKILEWSETPEAAFEIAVRLNDRYELDGRDPNGYAGIAWGIGGKHDRAWGPERRVFGTIRYMSYESTRRKFDSAGYIAKWLPSEEG